MTLKWRRHFCLRGVRMLMRTGKSACPTKPRGPAMLLSLRLERRMSTTWLGAWWRFWMWRSPLPRIRPSPGQCNASPPALCCEFWLSSSGFKPALLDLVIFSANVFFDLPIRMQFEDSLSGPRFCVRFRIVDRVVDLQGVMVHAAKAFDNMQGVGMRKAPGIEPVLIVETDRSHDECVTLVFPNRVPHVRQVEIFWMSSPIHKNLPRSRLIL